MDSSPGTRIDSIRRWHHSLIGISSQSRRAASQRRRRARGRRRGRTALCQRRPGHPRSIMRDTNETSRQALLRTILSLAPREFQWLGTMLSISNKSTRNRTTIKFINNHLQKQNNRLKLQRQIRSKRLQVSSLLNLSPTPFPRTAPAHKKIQENQDKCKRLQQISQQRTLIITAAARQALRAKEELAAIYPKIYQHLMDSVASYKAPPVPRHDSQSNKHVKPMDEHTSAMPPAPSA